MGFNCDDCHVTINPKGQLPDEDLEIRLQCRKLQNSKVQFEIYSSIDNCDVNHRIDYFID